MTAVPTALELPLAPLYVTEEPCDDPDRCVAPGLTHPMLASWATLDVRPDVDDSAAEIDHYYNPPRVLRYGRRPLRAGDRVEIVQGPLPTGDCVVEVGDWEVARWFDGQGGEGHHVYRPDTEGPFINLPAPGTVVGSAVIEWAGPIVDRMPPLEGRAWSVVTTHYGLHWTTWPGSRSARTIEVITGHEHVDWTPGRWAVKLREAVAT